jgi:hypothetical protein
VWGLNWLWWLDTLLLFAPFGWWCAPLWLYALSFLGVLVVLHWLVYRVFVRVSWALEVVDP